MNVNFEEVIINAIKNKWTGRIIFLGPQGGVVRVVFVEGKIKDVDSTWDSSPRELERIKEWKEGRVLLKELKSSEIEKYKFAPDINYIQRCPNCQKEIEENSNFCSNCGYKIKNIKICPNCGYENNLIDRFCKKCGYSFEKIKNFKLNKFLIIFPILLFLLIIFIFLFKPKNRCVYQILENKSFKIDSFYLKSNKIQIQYHSFGPYLIDQIDTLEISIKILEGKAWLFILSSQEMEKFKKQYDFKNYKLITDSSTIRYLPTEKNNYFVVISSPISIKNISPKPKGLLSLFKKSTETKEFEISWKTLKYNLILKLIKCPKN